MIGLGKSPEETAHAAKWGIDDIVAWKKDNAVSLDPAEAEAIYCLGSRPKQRALPHIKI